MTLPWEGRQCAAGWDGGTRDTLSFHTAPASLRISDEAAPQSGLVQLGSLQRCQITGWYRTDAGVAGDISMTCNDVDQKPIADVFVAHLASAPEWTQFRAISLAVPSTASARLRPAAGGKGSLWLDDVTFTPLATPMLVANGDMTLGGDLPESWILTSDWFYHRPYDPKEYGRDTATFRSAPASVRLGIRGDGHRYQAVQPLPLVAGVRYRVTGYVKDEQAPTGVTQPEGSIFVSTRGKDGGVLQTIQLSPAKPVAGWIPYSAEVTPAAETFVSEFVISGSHGPVWFDDISVEALPVFNPSSVLVN